MGILDKLMGKSEAGAGRGFVNPPTVAEMEDAKRTPQQREAIQEMKDAKDRAKIKAMGYSKGGKVGSASKRADGIATKGKTKGTMIAMCGGGMYKK
jgi:hypothetical protein